MGGIKITGTTVAIVIGAAAFLLVANRVNAAVSSTTTAIADQGRGALNPASSNNVVSRFAEWMYGGGSDGRGSIGTDLYVLINGEYDPNEN